MFNLILHTIEVHDAVLLLKVMLHGTTRNDDFQPNTTLQCWNNVAALCCAKNRRCESSRVTSPLDVKNAAKTIISGLHITIFRPIVSHQYRCDTLAIENLSPKKKVPICTRVFSQIFNVQILIFSRCMCCLSLPKQCNLYEFSR